jgi:hypothetical protein
MLTIQPVVEFNHCGMHFRALDLGFDLGAIWQGVYWHILLDYRRVRVSSQ